MFIYMMMFYMMLMMFIVFMIFLMILLNKMVFFFEFNFIKFMTMKMEFIILVDWVTLLFMNIVLLISFMVIFYSIEYMSGDKKFNQFFMLVYLFVLSMVMMIFSPNLLSILLGWDGLGLISYCLVIFYQSKNSFNSGLVTVFTNRLGDIMILISIGLMFTLGSWNYMYMNLSDEILFFLMVVSFTKSAQIPFSSWLPLAMAAPTPISSLVHSSTLVTAGVYLMIRLNYLFLNIELLNIIMMVSVITMFLSGLGASFEFDLKKVIALSTLSQLGVMFFSLSMKLEEVTLFHLLMHALFKSMLFMCAGVIIHNMLGNQDIRNISMVVYNMPMISMMFNCSTMSLCGIPFMSGFFSKDLILELFLMSLFNKIIMILLFMSMGLTIMYSIRLIYYTFVKLPRLLYFSSYMGSGNLMGISMYVLFIFSIVGGSLFSWSIFAMKNIIFLTVKFKLLIYFCMFMGSGLGFIMIINMPNIFMLFYLKKLLKFFSMMWFMPMLYTFWLGVMFKFSNKLIYCIEMGWMEYFLGGNLMNLLQKVYKLDFFSFNYIYSLILFLMIIIYLMY